MATARTAALILALAALPLPCQEAINTNAATQPGVGRTTLRQQVRWSTADQGLPPGTSRAEELLLTTSVFVGVRHDLTLGIVIPAALTDSDRPGDDTDTEIGDLRLLAKYRFHRADLGPIDTERASFLFGASIPSATDPALSPGFDRGSLDPIVGAVYTRVSGRQGWNAAVEGTLSTDDAPDDFRYDGAWLFRVTPVEYSAESTGAFYVVGELNGRYESNGDDEIFLSPGLMYEGRSWTAEFSVQLPIYQDLDRRPEVDFAVVLGLRLLF